MFSLGYALFVHGHYSRHTGIIVSLLDVLFEGFLFYSLMSLGK